MFSRSLKININILFFFGVLILLSTFFFHTAYAYGECSQYGFMATYDFLSGGCKCMSGYVFGKDILGQTSCVDANSICTDKYGYHSRYNSLSESCECSYGYILGKDSIGRTQCVSPDSICTDQLGYNATYNSVYDRCECRSGYVIDGGQCTYGNSVCHSKNGIYSSYNSINKRCECDDGYTLDDSNQCVKKQNNVYFTLKELDTDERKAIIRSDYDYKYYLISYNYGCYASSFRRYLNQQIVINLGTDFDLDTWDKIVLQNDNETCDITQREKADSDTTLQPKEEEIFYFAPQPSVVATPQPTINIFTPTPQTKKEFQFDGTKKKDYEGKSTPEANTSGTFKKCPSTKECGKETKPKQETQSIKISEATTTQQKQPQRDSSWYRKILSFFSRLFKR